EDEPQVLLGRITGDLDSGGEARIFGGHLDALAGGVVLPAVVEAADTIALDPAGRELRAPVRAARRDDVRGATLAAVEREVFAHDANRPGAAGGQVLGAGDRLPEAAKVAPGQGPRASVAEVLVIGLAAPTVRSHRSHHHPIPPRLEYLEILRVRHRLTRSIRVLLGPVSPRRPGAGASQCPCPRGSARDRHARLARARAGRACRTRPRWR